MKGKFTITDGLIDRIISNETVLKYLIERSSLLIDSKPLSCFNIATILMNQPEFESLKTRESLDDFIDEVDDDKIIGVIDINLEFCPTAIEMIDKFKDEGEEELSMQLLCNYILFYYGFLPVIYKDKKEDEAGRLLERVAKRLLRELKDIKQKYKEKTNLFNE